MSMGIRTSWLAWTVPALLLLGLNSTVAQQTPRPSQLQLPTSSEATKAFRDHPASQLLVPRPENQAAYPLDFGYAYRRARLETEAMLFERLEREAKLEGVRAALRETQTRLLAVHRLLRLPGGRELEETQRLLGNHMVPGQTTAVAQLAAARRALQAAVRLLERQAAEPIHEEILRAAIWFEIQRYVRIAASYAGPPGQQRGLGCQRLLEDAVKHTTQARSALERLPESLPADDPRQLPLKAFLADLGTTNEQLDEVSRQLARWVEQLEKVRQERFVLCPPEEGPADTATLARQALETLPLLKEQHATLETYESRLKELVQSVEKHRSGLDALTPASDAERVAWTTLRQAEQTLDNVFLLLWDAEQLLRGTGTAVKTGPCPICGHPAHQFIQLPDPVVACMKAQQRVAQVIQELQSLRDQTQELVAQLQRAHQTAPSDYDRRRIETALGRAAQDGAAAEQRFTDQIATAISRAEEFRQQQFDVYPVLRVWPEELPPAARQWAPMQAGYVARVNWYFPVYFDDINAERYGYHFGILQPFVSTARFYGDVLLWPYRAWLTPPWQPLSTEGLFRPGDDVPPALWLPPFDPFALAAAAGWWGLWISVFP
jgi:division protein CdvB (Snf7/Vps24/ESCRT-III family)